MNIKMTNEEKQCFMANYLNQWVAVINRHVIVHEPFPLQKVTAHNISLDCIEHIELRTVEMLTDDELVELIKLQISDDHPFRKGLIVTELRRYESWQPSIFFQFIEDGELSYSEVALLDGSKDLEKLSRKQIDYLRSIGVLVKFRHFTPEMLIAEGVVKIKEV